MRKRSSLLALLIAALLLLPGSALAQNYSFNVEKEDIHVYWNADGSSAIDYVFVFKNDPGASPIDFIDVGLPNDFFALNSVVAEVNGQPVTDITESPYVDSGVAVGLGQYAIPGGSTGTVHVFVGSQNGVLYGDREDKNYVSAVFGNTWFDSNFVHGPTDLTVTFHLPPGVKPEEPRWHSAPEGFPSTPETYIDQQGLVAYSWHNPTARGDRQYEFGASFPQSYVPAEAIKRPGLLERLNIDPEALVGGAMCLFPILVMLGIGWLTTRGASKRKLKYLPPKIAIEGLGIKRGLTAVEAAVLMEEPLDKVLTMILFGVLKKNAATVVTRDPLEIKAEDPLPAGLQPYESEFLAAFTEKNKAGRRKMLQSMMVTLVKGVGTKMKGFSHKETIAYYKDIMNKAWAQVETAETPEVKSQKYDEVMEWTMLDRNYDDRTKDVFRTGPVYVPTWWGRYDPGFGRTTSSAPTTTSIPKTSSPGGGINLPNLPGSDFAASMVRGVQNFSAGVIGNVTDFTAGVTIKTNPNLVVSSTTASRSGGRSSGGGGGHSCACACACAGCACACAGGGR